jgi:cold shock CspA family protein
MTGRIKNLNSGNRSGFIQAENGQAVYFGRSSVWEFDFPFLNVGQTVSFEMRGDVPPRAINVHLLEDRHGPPIPEKRPQGSAQLRYVGFEQANSLRTFRFQAVATGEETRDFAVTTDLALFVKYRVGIQEGPALCSRVVLAELNAARANRAPLTLTEKDILAHIASRMAAPRKPFHRRPRPWRPAVVR